MVCFFFGECRTKRATSIMPFGIPILIALCGCNDRIVSEHKLDRQRVVKDSASPVTDDHKPHRDIQQSTQDAVSAMVPVDPVSALAVANVGPIELLVPHKTFETDEQTGALKLTFEDLDLLRIFSREPAPEDLLSCLPNWMTSLDGQLVRITGIMQPAFQETRMTAFVLEKNIGQIYGYRPIKYYQGLLIKLMANTTTELVSQTKWLDVVGRFKIDLQVENGMVVLIYVIHDAKVIMR